MKIEWYKVTSLPGELEPNAFYFVENGTFAESYLTDSSGVARAIGNSAMIEAVVASLAGMSQIQLASDIDARDALVLDANTLVLVTDASDDTSVDSGAALYFYDAVGETWTKVAEYESMDVAVSWSSITGKPSSSTADIDDAVTKKHSHANKTVLDSISDSGGVLQYGGNPVDTRETDWATVNW